MKIQIDRTAIEVEFVDSATGTKKAFKLELCDDGDHVDVSAHVFKSIIDLQEKQCPCNANGTYRVSFSAAKAFLAALLLLEV